MRNDQKSLVTGPASESEKFHIYIERGLCRDNDEVQDVLNSTILIGATNIVKDGYP